MIIIKILKYNISITKVDKIYKFDFILLFIYRYKYIFNFKVLNMLTPLKLYQYLHVMWKLNNRIIQSIIFLLQLKHLIIIYSFFSNFLKLWLIIHARAPIMNSLMNILFILLVLAYLWCFIFYNLFWIFYILFISKFWKKIYYFYFFHYRVIL